MSLIQIVLDETESTQTDLKNELAKDASLANLSFVQAHVQKSGRGRQGRSWESPRGNLYLSVFLKEHFSTWTPHWVAVSLFDALMGVGVQETRISIKWPNDIYIDGEKKIAGIICEKTGGGVIAGVGVNVLNVPKGVDRPVTSLNEVVKREEEGLSEDTLPQLRDLFLEKLAHPTSLPVLQHQYQKKLLFKKGMQLHWRDEGSHTIQSAEFVSIGELGELCVRGLSGAEQKLYSEEVHLVSKPMMS